MPYKHRQDALEQHINAPGDTHLDHMKINDLHDKPADHETDHLMTCIGGLKAGEPVSASYPGPAVLYIIEGEIEGEAQAKPGEPFTAKKGDVVHIEKDAHMTWKTATSATILAVVYTPTSLQSWGDLVIKN